ncbi:MAG: hypothetical protein LAO55_12940 [Acidobacteriia bacterium]|nr:hypothetical protein [Terriglobia bacterium]
MIDAAPFMASSYHLTVTRKEADATSQSLLLRDAPSSPSMDRVAFAISNIGSVGTLRKQDRIF